jgi:hypothetical protein
MRHAWVIRVGIATLVGVMMLSTDFVLMADSAGAAPPSNISNTSGTTSWDKNLPSDSRFTVLSAFGSAAVRDNNTGLVWEQSPEMQNHNWFQALPLCANKIVGGTAGWRLPSVVEIKSLQDMSLPSPNIILSLPCRDSSHSTIGGRPRPARQTLTTPGSSILVGE